MTRTKAKSKASGKAKPKAERKVGRPSSFSPEFSGQAYKLCLLGATDKELADFFGVSEQTINAWKRAHPEFLESLKAGKAEADAKVAEKLFQRALGYEHPEDKIFLYEGKPVIVPTVKHHAPDTTAAIFWLKNRQPEKWRDKLDLNHGGQPDNPLNVLLQEISGTATSSPTARLAQQRSGEEEA